MRVIASRCAAVFGATFLVSVSVTAAPAPAAPTPGQVQSTLPTKNPQPKPAAGPAIGKSAPTPSGVAPGGPGVKITGFTFQGNTVIPTAELQAQVASYVGQSLTMAQLYDVADVLTRYYRAKGYGLASVNIPAQTLSGGNVRFEVFEDRIGKINIQGNQRVRTAVLQRRGAGLNSGDVYTDVAADRAVTMMNDIPGEQVRLVISPGADYGTSDMLFNVDEHATAGDVSVDDYGRDVIGRWRLNADFSINSLTGAGDQLTAGLTHSQDNLLNFGKLSYSIPTGTSSTLTTNYNRAFYHVQGGAFAAASVEGSTQNAGINWLNASERTHDKSFYWGLGLNYNNARSLSGVTETLSTNILLLQLTTFYTHTYDDQSIYTFSTNFWTNGKSNSDGLRKDAEKARLQLDTSWDKPFAQVWSFVAQGTASYSPDPLVDSDKYSLGGPGNVRGFQSAEVRGDRGLFASLELQRFLSTSPKFPLAWGFFVDSGKVWTKAAGTIPSSSANVSSVGTEFQLLPTASGWNARLQFAWAVGATRPSDDTPDRAVHDSDRGPHIWFSVGTSY